MKLYTDLAEYYYHIENKHRNISNDVSLIKSILYNVKNASVLDLGCGTGEHLAILARAGYKCTGIDNSIDMLTVAKKRNGGSIKYLLNSYVDFDIYEEFDLIMSFFGSLNYLLTDTEIETALWNTYRALKPLGDAVFEVWNAVPLIKISEKPLGIVSTTHYDGAKIIRERGFKILQKIPHTIVNVSYRYHVYNNNNLDMLDDTHKMRAFHYNEIAALLNKNGFKILNVYSSSLKEKFHENSNKFILHIQKK